MANSLIGQVQTLLTVDHTGPSSYQTGGESISSSVVGIDVFFFVQAAAFSASGTYTLLVLYPTPGASTSFTLAWYVAATGVQVSNGVNLSAEHVRLIVGGI